MNSNSFCYAFNLLKNFAKPSFRFSFDKPRVTISSSMRYYLAKVLLTFKFLDFEKEKTDALWIWLKTKMVDGTCAVVNINSLTAICSRSIRQSIIKSNASCQDVNEFIKNCPKLLRESLNRDHFDTEIIKWKFYYPIFHDDDDEDDEDDFDSDHFDDDSPSGGDDFDFHDDFYEEMYD